MNGAQIERHDRSKKNNGNRDWEGFKRPKNSDKGDSRNGNRTQLNHIRRQGGDATEDQMAIED